MHVMDCIAQKKLIQEQKTKNREQKENASHEYTMARLVGRAERTQGHRLPGELI